MRKSLWIVPVLFLFAAIGAPTVHADEIVQVTISDLTFNGNNVCGSGTALCTQTFSASFQWDNTTTSLVAGSFSFSTTGALGTSFTNFLSVLPVETSPSGVGMEVDNSEFDAIGIGIGGSPLVVGIYPQSTSAPATAGTFVAALSCGGPATVCPPDFQNTTNPFLIPATAGTVTVTSAVPEPGTAGLTLIGIGLVLVTRKRIAWGLRQGHLNAS
jgi:hypothetical protein